MSTSTRLLAFLFLFNTFLPIYATDEIPDIAESGAVFAETCTSIDKAQVNFRSRDLLNVGTCAGYVKGFSDAMNVSYINSVQQKKDPGRIGYCIPDNSSMKQLIHVVLKYIKDHPEREHEQTAALVISAFRRSFPCR